ncbi:MAG TPA: hydroxymethylbilane synthase, partial [Polyangia bacterium]
HALVDGARLTIEGLVGAPDGSKLLRHSLEGTTEDAAAVGHALAEELLRQGADRLLAFTTTEIVGGE